jgi:hypothetical protein
LIMFVTFVPPNGIAVWQFRQRSEIVRNDAVHACPSISLCAFRVNLFASSWPISSWPRGE